MPLSKTFKLYRGGQFYWWRKQEDLQKTTDKFYLIMLYTLPWSRFEPTTSVVIGTDSIDRCKSNYHTITTTTEQIENQKKNQINWKLRWVSIGAETNYYMSFKLFDVLYSIRKNNLKILMWLYKISMKKIPKGQSQAVYHLNTNNDLQNITTENRGWTWVLRKD
jgi:hypothetical protein